MTLRVCSLSSSHTCTDSVIAAFLEDMMGHSTDGLRVGSVTGLSKPSNQKNDRSAAFHRPLLPCIGMHVAPHVLFFVCEAARGASFVASIESLTKSRTSWRAGARQTSRCTPGEATTEHPADRALRSRNGRLNRHMVASIVPSKSWKRKTCRCEMRPAVAPRAACAVRASLALNRCVRLRFR